MSDDRQLALASLRHEQGKLRERVKGLEDQRRLHEKLGYSRYYLDMQLEALKGELAVCDYRVLIIEKGAPVQGRGRRRQRPEAIVENEVSSRYLLPVVGAFIISILALSAAGLLWFQRVGQQTPTATPTAIVVVSPIPTQEPPIVVSTPTTVTLVYAVVTTDGLNVRKSGSASAPVVVILPRGKVVKLTGDQVDADGRQWYRLDDGGWVATEHVKIFNSQEEADAFAGSLGQ
ncbi:MAG: SH3 domain-containing protein [Chloroflexota bacterium]